MKQHVRVLAALLCLAVLLPLFSACSQPAVPPSDDQTPQENGTVSTPPPTERGIVLAHEQKSNYRIIISQTASEDTEKMAAEFSDYIEKISGVRLPIETDATEPQPYEVVIGKTTRGIDSEVDYDTLGEEEYVYLSRENDILLTGATDRAMAYAVYAYLEERIGVRYLTPDVEYIPQKTTILLQRNHSRQVSPGFAFRTLEGAGASDPKWAVKMRLNSRQSLGSQNYKRTFFVGGGIGYADWYVHTITKLAELPATDENGNYNTAQPCLTDEAVYQTVLKNVRKWLELYPDANIVSISQNDGGDEASMCSCENCSKLYNQYGNVQSALWIHFVSRIANELKDEYPNVYFDTLAYSFTLLPPTGLKAPENVIIRLAPIGACYEHGACSCANESGAARAQRISARLQLALDGWKNVCSQIYVWEYSAPFANYWAPLANLNALRANIEHYYDNGITGFYMQGASETPLSELYTYLTAKLLWEPDMTEEVFDKLTKEFLTLYYGSSEGLSEYLSLVDTEAQKSHYSTHAVLGVDFLKPVFIEGANGTTLDTTFIDKMKTAFDKAEAATNTEEQRARLRKARISLKYYELICLFLLDEDYENAIFDEEYRTALGKELYEDVKASGITQISERVNSIPTNPNFNNPPLRWNNGAGDTTTQY